MCVFLLFQFQTELRKILVSLIEVAQKLLALNPDAVELFKKANGKTLKPVFRAMSVVKIMNYFILHVTDTL